MATFRPHSWSTTQQQQQQQPPRHPLRRQSFPSAPELRVREPVARNTLPASPPLPRPRPRREPLQACGGSHFSVLPPPPLPPPVAPLWSSQGDEAAVSMQLSRSLTPPTSRQRRGHPRAREYLQQLLHEWHSQCRGSGRNMQRHRRDSSALSWSPERYMSPRSSRGSFQTAVVVERQDEEGVEDEVGGSGDFEYTQLPLVSSPEVSSIRASPARDSFTRNIVDPGLTTPETLRGEVGSIDDLRQQLSQQRSKMETAMRSLSSAGPRTPCRLADDSALSSPFQVGGETSAGKVKLPSAISDLHAALQDGREETVKFSSRVLEQLDDLRARCDTTAASIGIVRSEMFERHGKTAAEVDQLRSKFEAALGSTEEASVRCLAQVAALESAFLEARATWHREAQSLRGFQAQTVQSPDIAQLEEDLQRRFESESKAMEDSLKALESQLKSLQEGNLRRDHLLQNLQRTTEEMRQELAHRQLQDRTSDISEVSSSIVAELRDRLESHDQQLATLGHASEALQCLRRELHQQKQQHEHHQQQQHELQLQQQQTSQKHQQQKHQEQATQLQQLQQRVVAWEQHCEEQGRRHCQALTSIRDLEASTKLQLQQLQQELRAQETPVLREELWRHQGQGSTSDEEAGTARISDSEASAKPQQCHGTVGADKDGLAARLSDLEAATKVQSQQLQQLQYLHEQVQALQGKHPQGQGSMSFEKENLAARICDLESSTREQLQLLKEQLRTWEHRCSEEQLQQRPIDADKECLVDRIRDLEASTEEKHQEQQRFFQKGLSSLESRLCASEKAAQETKGNASSESRLEVLERAMQDVNTHLRRHHHELAGLAKTSQATRQDVSRLETYIVKGGLASSEACNSIVDVMGSILTSCEHDLLEALSAGASSLELLDERQRQSFGELDSILGRTLEPCSREEATQPNLAAPSIESQLQDRAQLEELTRRLSMLGAAIVSHGEALARLEQSQQQLESQQQQQQQQLQQVSDSSQHTRFAASLEDLAGLDCRSDISNLRHRLDDLAKDCECHWVHIDKKFLDLDLKASQGQSMARSVRAGRSCTAESKRLQAKLSTMLALDTMEAASEKLISAVECCATTSTGEHQTSSCSANEAT